MAECNPNATRRVPLEFAEDGGPRFKSVCSPESFKPNALCIAPPRHVIPVIFVGGIMATNLRNKKTKVSVWQPPNGIGEGLDEVFVRADQSPAERQTQLNPNDTEIDNAGFVKIPQSLYTLTTEEAKRRGWGEIHWDGYGKVLMELELMLNDQYEECGTKYAKEMPVWKLAQAIKEKTHKEHWGSKGDARDITADEFTRMDDYYYPVWVCGYNWMQSNEQSALTLQKRIDEVLAWYRKAGYFVPEGRVIIITHSMGGLVARRCAQFPGMAEKILGIVHGVQPTLGAPVVYRRFRAGTENGGFFDVVGKLAAIIIGWDAADMTCVLAHSPGALELLPTKHYEPGWLKIVNGKDKLASLPKADPYSEIYATKVQDVWWGMVDETLIDPAGLVPKAIKPFEAYRDALIEARDFHNTLGLYFHPNTYAHYGMDKGKNSFHNVCWETEATSYERSAPPISTQQAGDLMQAKTPYWTKRGHCRVDFNGEQIRFNLAGKDGGGDATVPEPSGKKVEDLALKATFRMKGFEHAFSYNDRHVLDNTVYCVGRIVQGATPVKQLPQKGKLCSPADYAAALSATPDTSSDTSSSPSPSSVSSPTDTQPGAAL